MKKVLGMFVGAVLGGVCLLAAETVTVEVPAKQDTVVALPISDASKPAADIVQKNEQTEGNQLAYPALKDDLVNAGAPYLAGVKHDNLTVYQGCRIEALNDGELGRESDQAGVAFDLDGDWTTTFTLDTTKSPKGYDITEIHTIAGWPALRANQKYELLVAKVAAPEQFVSLGTYEFAPDITGSSRITLTKQGAPLAAGIAAIRFHFLPQRPGAETAYREVDVIGAPAR